MASCELCGATPAPFTNQIEGATMRVCKKCSSTGRILDEAQDKPRFNPHTRVRETRKQEVEETLEIRLDFRDVFLTERNKRKMTQEEFAQFLNIKQSMAAAFESGAHKPSLGLAQKMEKVLKVPLVEVVSTKSEFELSKKVSNTGGMTLGHFIKIKEKKKN